MIMRLFVKITWFIVSLQISYKIGTAKNHVTKTSAYSIFAKEAMYKESKNKMHQEISGTQENLIVSRIFSPGKRAIFSFDDFEDTFFFVGVEKSQSKLSIFRLWYEISFLE